METRGLKRIGTGKFSRVYKMSDKKVLIASVDPVKEAMGLGWFPKSRMFPKLTRIGAADGCQYYTEKYYKRTKGLKNHLRSEEWEFYKKLYDIAHMYNGDPYKIIKDLKKSYRYRAQVLQEALDTLENYGRRIYFEISPRNVAVYRGRLVLLDCFFMG
jgi:hypothetical protein